jgi:tetratricopeptide (TPR) repeat protein
MDSPRHHLPAGRHDRKAPIFKAGGSSVRATGRLFQSLPARSLACLLVLMVGCSNPRDQASPSETASPQTASPQTASPQTAAKNAQASGDRDQRIEQADQWFEAGQFDRASALLREQLLADPDDVEVIFRLANLSAASGNLAEGIEFLDLIPEDNFEAGLPALGQSADWCVQLEKYDEAERRYRAILRIAPDAAIAHRRLGQLLNRQGRRHEAAEHIRQLCKMGDFRQDELHALVVLSDAMAGDPSESSDDSVDYTPIGASGRARVLFTERRYDEAAEALREWVTAGGSFTPSVSALYGRALAEAQDDGAFLQWLGALSDVDAVSEHSEYWSAIGTYLAGKQQHEPAARALLEALERDPTDFRSMNRLHQMLTSLGKLEEAKRWELRWNANKKVLLANNDISNSSTPNVVAMDEMASQLSGLGRNLEAVLWKSLEAYHRKLPVDALEHWNRERLKLVEAGNAFPSSSQRVCEMQLAAFALPDLERLGRSAPVRSPAASRSVAQLSTPRFRNAAEEVQLAHTYELASKPVESGFTMYHQAGGGVAVLDFDRDGQVDLYFAQGAADPPEFVSRQPNQLLRQIDRRLVDVTDPSAAGDLHYTIGCTAGDWNQDGFPDLITSNIGPNRLLINNGDGTFTAHEIPGSDDRQRMPASVAIADLNADGLADLFEANYIQDSKIAMLPERDSAGRVIEAVGPADFAPASDRVGINDGRGGFQFLSLAEDPSKIFRGLGVVIADLDQQPGNDIFVGNDKSPNQLWVRDPKSNAWESNAWSDIAMVAGVAYSFDGGGTASMGIAAGDFDQSGTLDLHVANFQNENACLYLQQDGFFQDRVAQFRLGVPSFQVLGFGSQSLDFDNDGRLDLAVTNGHIDNYLKMSGPFRQKAQLFANLGNRFELQDVEDASGYWGTPHLGRAMARLDFNRDGRSDLVITHLNERSALVLNETETPGHWLQVELVGITTERDAIGAKVTVESGDQRWTEWLVGGDGYLCRNEQVLSFGLGLMTKVDRVQIDWPSGNQQSLEQVPADCRILVVEDEAGWFELAR